jgi:hypothetical protein
MEGSIRLFRCILESQVFAHQIALKIWIWCLCKATWKERFVPLKIGRGEIVVKLIPGQFIFGRFKAEEELGIDGSTIYKWIQKFASTEYNMIIIESNNQYSIITICKWSEYQIDEKRKVTTKEQPSNNQVTAEEQPSNTNNKDNKDNKDNKTEYAEFVFLKQSEYGKLVLDHGEENTKILIQILDNYKGAKGAKYKSDYRAILNWVIDRAKKDGKYVQERKITGYTGSNIPKELLGEIGKM